MDKRLIYAVAVVAILVLAVGVVFIINDEDEPQKEVTSFDNAELKVFGNVNGDRFIDENDKKLIEKYISNNNTVEEKPLADVNQDGMIDKKDIEVINKIINREPTTIWHINYFDYDENGTMDSIVESTKFPINSAIFHGSTNNLNFMFCLGIIDEIKGISYSENAGTADFGLYGDFYLNPDKCVKLSGSNSKIDFENGKIGSSEIIKEEKVTGLVASWNKGMIPNWQDFENVNVDVIRIASADSEPVTLTHSAMLLGLLFDKVDRANSYVDKCIEINEFVKKKTENITPVKAVASSSTGRISGPNSDYTGYIVDAGGVFGLDGIDFGNHSSLKVAEHPEMFTYDFQKIIHIKAALQYEQNPDDVKKNWETYTSTMKDFKYAEEGQYMVSGTMPPVLRMAYIAVALYPDVVTLEDVTNFHKEIAEEFFNGVQVDFENTKFLVTPADMA